MRHLGAPLKARLCKADGLQFLERTTANFVRKRGRPIWIKNVRTTVIPREAARSAYALRSEWFPSELWLHALCTGSKTGCPAGTWDALREHTGLPVQQGALEQPVTLKEVVVAACSEPHDERNI